MTSGKHRGPRYLLTFASAAQKERWQRAAAKMGLPLSSWIRLCCDSETDVKEIQVYAPGLLGGKRRKG